MEHKRHWSASSWSVDQACRRRGYYHSVLGGKGVEPVSAHRPRELVFGGAYHVGLAAVRRGQGLDQALVAATQELGGLSYLPALEQQEYQWLLEGMLRGWYTHRWPQEEQEYRIEEGWVELKLADPTSGLVAIVDWVVPSRVTGRLVYQEEKTTSYNNAEWLLGWEHKVQLLSGPHCFEVTHPPQQVDGTIICGHYKGSQRKLGGVRQLVSLYVRGWWNPSLGPQSWQEDRPQKWAGWELAPAWEVFDSPEALVAGLTAEQLTPYFLQTQEFDLNREQLQRWLRQSAHRERIKAEAARWDPADPATLAKVDEHFPQNFEHCEQLRFGRVEVCPFYQCCWHRVDPLQSRDFRPREEGGWQTLLDG